jgi:catechol 2,3-dioxygenase-like lactoylglutathione lyase family enzyme
MTTIALTVGHVGLNVSDLDRSQAFYTGLFRLDAGT